MSSNENHGGARRRDRRFTSRFSVLDTELTRQIAQRRLDQVPTRTRRQRNRAGHPNKDQRAARQHQLQQFGPKSGHSSRLSPRAAAFRTSLAGLVTV